MVKSDRWNAFYWDDYTRDTLGLSLSEHGAYFLLIKAYYMQGHMPSHCERYRIAYATEDTEKDAVDRVLSKFFVRDGDFWRHNRVEEELKKRCGIKEKAVESAKKRWSADKKKGAQYKGNAKAYAEAQPHAHAEALPTDMLTRTTTIEKKELTSVSSKESAPAKNPEPEFSSLPPDWVLPDDWREDMRTYFALSPVKLTEEMIEHSAMVFRDWKIKEGKQSRHWRQEWSVWCSREPGRMAKQLKQKRTINDVEREIYEEVERIHADMVKRGNPSGDDGVGELLRNA